MQYPSKYSNGKTVSAAQYITEIICENKAKIDKKDLHFKFWTNKEWSRFYKDQIASAIKLLKKYPEKAIINALHNPKASRIFSLRAPFLTPIIEKEAEILESQNQTLSKEFDRSTKKTFNTKTNKKSIISKLKDLE